MSFGPKAYKWKSLGGSVPVLLSLALVMAALGLTVSNGIMVESARRHFDGRYFYAAAECLGRGASPYDVTRFGECWTAVTGTPFRSSFVFPPPSFLYAYPMSWMDWETAQLYLDLLGIVSLLLLTLVLWSLAGVGDARGWARLQAALWVALGVSNTGVVGSLFLGQPGVFVALGLALLVRGMILPVRPHLLIGTLLAALKPHVSAIPVAVAWFSRPRAHVREKIAFLGVIAGLVLLLFVLSATPLADYRSALEVHTGSKFSHLITSEQLYGLRGFLSLTAGMPYALPALFVLLALGVSVVLRLQERCRWEVAAFALAIFGGAFAFPHKEYDFAIYAVVFALVARSSPWLQAVLLPVFLLIWRPSILTIFVKDPAMQILGIDMCFVFLIGLFAALLLRALIPRGTEPGGM